MYLHLTSFLALPLMCPSALDRTVCEMQVQRGVDPQGAKDCSSDRQGKRKGIFGLNALALLGG